MPAVLTQAGQTQSWRYTPEHDRYKLTAVGRTTWYINPGIQQGGHYEQTKYASGTLEHRIALYGGGRPVGEIVSFADSSPAQTRYFHGDAQDSIVAVTDGAGQIVARYRYDPWGKQTVVSGANTGIGQTRQGHTGHEMLDGGLTHMNGRLYDPVLARFVSADPYIDTPFDLQSLNRYSYVNNNPMGYTDPSGHIKLGKKLKKLFKSKIFRTVVAVGAAAYLGPIAANFGYWGAGGAALGTGASAATASFIGGVAGGALGGAVAGAIGGGLLGGVDGALQGAKLGALGGALFGAAGEIGSSFGEQGVSHYTAHATAGCISASAGGGDCARGAASGVAGLYGTNYGGLGAVVAGGTASALGGRKFANGAVTAGFGYLFNHCAHDPSGCSFWDRVNERYSETSKFIDSTMDNALPWPVNSPEGLATAAGGGLAAKDYGGSTALQEAVKVAKEYKNTSFSLFRTVARPDIVRVGATTAINALAVNIAWKGGLYVGSIISEAISGGK